MAWARLEFELPDEQQEFRDAVNGAAWKDLLDELWTHYGSVAEHGEGPAAEAAAEVRQRISSELTDRGLDLWH